MKRMTLIALILCAAVIATSGAGVVMAKQTTPQKGNSGVYQFDVSDGTHTVGKLTVNTNGKTPTYVFNGVGTAGASYALWYLTNTLAGGGVGTAVAAADGSVHMQGAWTNPVADIAAKPVFKLAQPGENTLLPSALTLTASPTKPAGPYDGWGVTLTAKLTISSVTEGGLTTTVNPANQHIYLQTDDGQTLPGTTDANGQCTWTRGMPGGDVSGHTYTVKYDGTTIDLTQFIIPMYIQVGQSQGSATFANPLFINAISLHNRGAFVCQFTANAEEARYLSPPIYAGQTKCIDCAVLGAPPGSMLAWGYVGHIDIIILLGADRTASAPFYYSRGSPNVAHYTISGTTLISHVTYNGEWIGC